MQKMKELNFKIDFNNHIFSVRANYLSEVCSYDIENRYKACLDFTKNMIAQLRYKNIIFSGTVTKQNIWRIRLDMHCIIHKRYNMCYFEKAKQNDNNIISSDNPIKDYSDITDYPENILCLYEHIIDELSEQYSLIQDKKEFEQQMCEYLFDSYPDIKNLDETLEYENWDDIGDDEEPIIETIIVRNAIIKECKERFLSYYQSEIDNKNKESIITLENIIKEVPVLNIIPRSYLCKEFERYMDENYKDLINPYIYYNLTDVLKHIGTELYEEYQYYIFINSMENKIEKTLSIMNVSVVSKDEVCDYFKTKYRKDKIPDDKEFEQDVTTHINNYLEFYNFYNKFFTLFNSDNIKLKWDDEKIRIFQKYDKNELPIDSKYLAEYEAYKYIMPLYKKHLFRKNSNKYKPSIEQFSNFISYASLVLDILFKYNILIDNEDNIIYNEDADTSSAHEEIVKMSTQ